jgi:hypothetical protein
MFNSDYLQGDRFGKNLPPVFLYVLLVYFTGFQIQVFVFKDMFKFSLIYGESLVFQDFSNLT